MRRLLILLVILGGLAVVGDYAFRNAVEGRAAEQVGAVIHADSEPEVDIGGWPFTTQLLGGRFDEVDIEARSLTIEGVRFSRAVITLRGVEADIQEALDGNAAVKVRSGDGSAFLSERTLQEMLAAQGVELEVHLTRSGVELRHPGAPVGRGDLSIEGESLVVASSDGAISESVTLPSFADGASFTSVRTTDRGARLSLEIGATTLRR